MEVNVHTPDNITYNFTSQTVANSSSSDNSSTIPELRPPLYVYIYVTTINTIVFFLGVIGNVLVIQVVATVRAMRKRMNYFLVSLSVADLMVLLVGLPTALHEFYGREKWYLGEVMCKLVPFMENASHHCSILTLLAIGFERYYAICHPLRETLGSRVASTAILLPATWIISCGVSMPFALITNIKISTYYDNSQVTTCQTDMSSSLYRAYIIIISVLLLALPLLLLTVLYSAIIRTLHTSTTSSQLISDTAPGSAAGRQNLYENNVRNARAISSRRQVVRMMVGVMVLYFVCLVPLRCVQLWLVFGNESDLISLGFEGYLNVINCVRILVCVNSAGNPIIYSLLSSNFRTAFRQLFSRNRPNRYRSSNYNSQYYNHNSYPQLQESTIIETTRLERIPSFRPNVDIKKNGTPEEHTSLSNVRNRNNSPCCDNSVDRVMSPLLKQNVPVEMGSDVAGNGYPQMKPGLAYV